MKVLYVDSALDFQIVHITRDDWGANQATEDFIAQRFTAPKSAKICYQIHHTAATDIDDSTPNLWSYDEAAAYMVKLQWSRPDLGPLPYPENPCLSEDLETVWLFEGRGLEAVGAHTADHNYHGQALGWLGNFDKPTSDRALQVARRAVEWRAGDLKHNQGFANLGSELSPKGWEVWGHRDSAAKSCPGNLLYPVLSTVHYIEPEDDMTPLQARLELASAWHAKSGVWMSPTSTEDPQVRLTRLALEVAGNVRTVADIVAFAPVGTPKNEPVPAWVLDPAVPYSVLPSVKLPDEEVVRLIRA